MTEQRIELTITPGEIPLSTLYAEREQAREDERWQEMLSATGGLDATADRMQQAGGGQTSRVRSPLESTSEVLREQALTQMREPAIRKAVDVALRTLAGIGVDEFQRAVVTGTLPEKVSLRLMDPLGNTAETVARETAERDGLAPELVDRVATITGLFAGLGVPGKGSKAGKAGKLAKDVAEGAVTAESKLNTARVKAPERVKALMADVNRQQSTRLAGQRATQTHGMTIEASRGVFASLEDALAARAEDLAVDKGKALAFRDYYNAVGRQVDDLATRALDGDTDAAQALPEAFAFLGEMAIKDELAGKTLARGLEARKILSDADRVAVAALEQDAQRIREAITAQRQAATQLKTEIAAAQKAANLPKLEREYERVGETIAKLEGQLAQAGENQKAAAALKEMLGEERKLADRLRKDVAAGERASVAIERVGAAIAKTQTQIDEATDAARLSAVLQATLEEQKALAAALRGELAAAKKTGAVTPKLERDIQQAQATVDRLSQGLRDALDEQKQSALLTEHLADEKKRAADLKAQIAEARKGVNLDRLEKQVREAEDTIDALELDLAEARGIFDRARGLAQNPLSPADVAKLADLYRGAVAADPLTMARRLKALTGQQQKDLAAKIAKAAKRGDRSIFYELWINALLSGPQTHAANITSNTLTALWAPAERFLAATASAGEAFVTLGQHPRQVFYGESAAMLYGLAGGMRDGIRLAAKALKEGASGLGPEKAEGAEAIRRGFVAADDPIGHGLGFWSTLWRLPTRMLTTEDAFFKAVNYRMELRALAYREAAQEGLTGKAFAERMRQIIADPPEAVKSRAEAMALVRTLNRELFDLGNIGQVARGVSTAVDAIPAGRLLMPFVRTPANIMHYTVERTPLLNLFADTIRADIKAGGAQRAEAIGKIAGGAMLAGVVTHLAAAGVITGGGPRDPDQKRARMETGWRPYSVKIGDTWYAINRLDPAGALIGIVADATEIMGQIPHWQANELATALTLAVARNLVSKTYMEGVANVIEAFESPERNLGQIGKSLARTLVPTAVRTVERTLDPTVRETMVDPEGSWKEVRAFLNEIQSVTPGWSSSLPPRRNLFGEPIVLPGGWGPDMVSPVYASPEKDDPVAAEIARQRVSLSMPPRTIFGTRRPSVRMQEERLTEGVPLNPREYDLYVRLAGNELKDPATGLGMKDSLAALIASEEYRRQSDGPDGGKALLIRRTVTAFREAARAKLLEQSPGLEDLIERRLEDRATKLAPAPDAGALLQSLGR